jgi:hypothetical protein
MARLTAAAAAAWPQPVTLAGLVLARVVVLSVPDT